MTLTLPNDVGRRKFLKRGAVAAIGLGYLAAPRLPGDAQIVPGSFLFVDATELSRGTTVSLDALDFDVKAPPGSLFQDVTFGGLAQFRSGRRVPFQVVIAQQYANVLSLQTAPNEPGLFNIVAQGDPQPLDGPHLVGFTERVVPGTSITRLTGQLFDPKNRLRMNFTITHDPAPIIVVGIVAGIAALICGAIVLVEAIIDDCIKQARQQCGERRVKKITVQRTYGFSWRKGGPEIGCGQECIIECNGA